MREIKFRAWDNKWKVMVTHFHVKSQNDEKSKISFVAYPIYRDDIPSSNQNLEGDYELMQYTGLKDKNGKEIYEGDVLAKSPNTYYEPRPIVWDEHYACFGIKADEDEDAVPLNKHYAKTEYEIIGNIYENPELLDGKVLKK